MIVGNASMPKRYGSNLNTTGQNKCRQRTPLYRAWRMRDSHDAQNMSVHASASWSCDLCVYETRHPWS